MFVTISRQRIKPITTNKALSGPFYPVTGPLYPGGPPPRSRGSGWSASALLIKYYQSTEFTLH